MVIISGLFWIVFGLGYIVYKGFREEKEITKSALKWLAMFCVLFVLPNLLVYAIFGETVQAWFSVLTLFIPGLCLCIYAIYWNIKGNHQINKSNAEEQASAEDRRRQAELSITPVTELCHSLGLSYVDIREGQSNSNITALAIAEIMRRENRKYTGYDLRYSAYAKRFQGFLDGSLDTLSQRKASLELLYETNPTEFEKIVEHKFNDKNMAIYDVLIREGYYSSPNEQEYMQRYRMAVKRIRELATMERYDFDKIVNGSVSDWQNTHRGSLIKLIGIQEGWLKPVEKPMIIMGMTFFLSDYDISHTFVKDIAPNDCQECKSADSDALSGDTV